jgi:hypothetical protein
LTQRNDEFLLSIQLFSQSWFVPDPAEQFHNPYLAMGNTPVNGTDPNGEFFLGTLFTGAVEWVKAITETQAEFYKTVFTDQTWDEFGDESRETWRDFDPTNPGTNFNNAVKIDLGSFQGDFGQVLSRWTWELPQTLMGKGYGHFSNILGRVNGVGYFDGATVVNVTDLPLDGDNARGVAFGSFIYGEDIAFDPFETFAGTNAITPGARLLRHEYGHYIQSQKNGWTYLFKYGLPSAMGAEWTEFDAELRSNTYFREKYPDHPTTVNGNNFFSLPSGLQVVNAKWWEHTLVFSGLFGGALVTILNRNNP